MAEELVAQTLAATRPLDQAGDIDKLDGGRQNRLGTDDFRQLVQPGIGNPNHADVRLDGTKRVVGRFGAGGGNRVENRRLADIGQTDNATFKTHGLINLRK